MLGKLGYGVAMVATCVATGALVGLVFNFFYGMAA